MAMSIDRLMLTLDAQILEDEYRLVTAQLARNIAERNEIALESRLKKAKKRIAKVKALYDNGITLLEAKKGGGFREYIDLTI